MKRFLSFMSVLQRSVTDSYFFVFGSNIFVYAFSTNNFIFLLEASPQELSLELQILQGKQSNVLLKMLVVVMKSRHLWTLHEFLGLLSSV